MNIYRAVSSPVRVLPALAAVVALAALAPTPGSATSFHSTAIDITPDGQEVWVVNPDHGSVSVIQAQAPGANTLLAEIPVGRDPWCLDIHPNNGEVWVASHRDDRIVILDAATRTVIDSLDAGYETFGIAFNPAGDTALVTATGSDEVFLVDVATRSITHTFKTYRRPRGIAWQPDGLRAWISHLLTFEYFGRLTEFRADSTSCREILTLQVFGLDRAGYPSAMQNITLAPGDSLLWIPNNLINSAKGALSGHLLTPTNTFHAVIRPVDVRTGTDLNWDTYFLSDGGSPSKGYTGGTTPVGGPIAVDFAGSRAYVANLYSNDVTVLGDDILNPQEHRVFPAGDAPIGVVTHPTLARVYVANWLSRDVTVFDTGTDTVIATVPTTGSEVLPARVLNGKRLFFTSTGRMSLENRNSCAGCHVFGRPDGRNWDLSQYGTRKARATKDWRGSGYTGVLGWTAAFDEIHDNEWSIRGIHGGAGLITGTPNASLGPPNQGVSDDLDDLSTFIALQVPRPDTPYLAADGSLTASADSGQALFNDPLVGCASCHPAPFFTDSSLQQPYLRHDVGTADPTDADAAAGLDTPTLAGVWDTAPYLHTHQAKTIEAVLTTFNPNDLHGVTSHLSPAQIGFLADYVKSIGWPDSTGTPVAAPEFPADHGTRLAATFPNPFSDRTSLRFQVAAGPSRVQIEIFDVAGRRILSLLDRPMPRGTHIVGWDARDGNGRPVSPGLYLARLAVDGRTVHAKKMVVLR